MLNQNVPWAEGINQVVKQYIKEVARSQLGDGAEAIPESVFNAGVRMTYQFPDHPLFNMAPDICIGYEKATNEYCVCFRWDWTEIGELEVLVFETRMKFTGWVGPSRIEGEDVHNGSWCQGVLLILQQAFNAVRMRDARNAQESVRKKEDTDDENNNGPLLH